MEKKGKEEQREHKRRKNQRALIFYGTPLMHGHTWFAGGSDFGTGEMVKRFLRLMCAGDVLNSVRPLSDPQREITRAMIAMQHLKGILLRSKEEHVLVELNPGIGLAGVLAAHLFPQLKKVCCFSNGPTIPTVFSELKLAKEAGNNLGSSFHEVKGFEFVPGDFDLSRNTFYEIPKIQKVVGTDGNTNRILLCTNAHPAITKLLTSLVRNGSMFKHAIIIPIGDKLPEPLCDIPNTMKGIYEVKREFWLHSIAESIGGYFNTYKGFLLPMGGTILYPKKVKKGVIVQPKVNI